MPFLVNPRKKEPKNLPKPFQFQETKPCDRQRIDR